MSLLFKSVFLFQELSKVLAEGIPNLLVVHAHVVPRRGCFCPEPLTLVLSHKRRLLVLLDVLRYLE